MEQRRKALLALDACGLHGTVYEHPAVWTMEDCLAIPGIDWTAVEMPKNLFLCNRQQTAFFLMLTPHDAPFRTAAASRALGVSRLSFAPDALLPSLLGLEAGAVSPLGLHHDSGRRVQLVVDDRLLPYARLAFHPCDNRATVVLDAADFFNVFLPYTGHLPVWVDVKGDIGT